MSSATTKRLNQLSEKWNRILNQFDAYLDSVLEEPIPVFREFPPALHAELKSKFRDLPTLQVGFSVIKKSLENYHSRLQDIRARGQYGEREKLLKTELARLIAMSRQRARGLKEQKEDLEAALRRYDAEMHARGEEANAAAQKQIQQMTDFERKTAQVQQAIFSEFGTKTEATTLDQLGTFANLEPEERTKFAQRFNQLNKRTAAAVKKFQRAKDHLENIGDAADRAIGKLEQYDEDAAVVEDKFAELRETVHTIEDLLVNLQTDLQFAKGEAKQTRTSECASLATGPRIADRPCVEIFELKPPPPVDLNNFANYREVQRYVADRFALFKWPSFRWKPGGDCKTKNTINNVQKLSYHYMQPYNPNLNVLLAHSAGSGKTCTALLIASIFARQGYTPIIVTKSTLKAIYMKEAFKNGCDFNLQQYLKFHDAKRLQETLPQGANLINEGIKVLKNMGVHFSEEQCVMTYNQFSRLAERASGKSVAASQARLTFLRSNPHKAAVPGDPIANCVVIIDEAHKLVARSTDLNPSEQGDFLAMQKLVWNSRKRSREQAARLVLLSATPVADSPIDVINLLSLLGTEEEADELRLLPRNYRVPRKSATGRAPGEASAWEQVKTTMEKNFLRDYVDRNGNLKDHTRAKLQRLGMGRISYFDFSGDGNRFARPVISWVNVNLTNFQAEGVADCFREYAGLRYNRTNGQWDFREKKQQAKKTKRLRKTKPAAPGVLLFEDAPEEDVLDWLAEKTTSSPAAAPKVKNLDKLKECVAKNYNWPRKDKSPKMKTFRDTLRAPRMNTVADLVDNSAVLARLVQNVRSDKGESKIILQEYYRHEPPPDKPLLYVKQFIFTDLAGSKATDLYGVDLIAAWLKKAGYRAINRTSPSGKLIIDGPEKRDQNPYKNMIVLNNDWSKTDRATSRKVEQLRDIFNAPDNIDGRDVYLCLVNGKFKEGLSLAHVGYIHIVGYISSRADLVQAVARGIRNCKHDGVPFYPDQGWPVKVQIYNPVFAPRSMWGKSQYSPEELIASLSTSVERVKGQMNDFVRDVAYDKLLLENINTMSKEISDQLQIASSS